MSTSSTEQTGVRFDTTKFDDMVRRLSGYDARHTKPVVNGITSEILALTASRTKATTAKKINKNIASIFKRPFRAEGQGKVGVTSSGKVWAKLDTWGGGKRWALLNEEGKLKNAPKRSIRTTGARAGQPVNLGQNNRNQINSMIQVAKDFQKNEKKYRTSVRGLSKATWYYIMKQLDFTIPQSAPGYAIDLANNMPNAARNAISAFDNLANDDKYEIKISNQVQACLNQHAGGLRQFKRSLDGKVKEFERRLKADAVGFAQRFAQKNGFSVA